MPQSGGRDFVANSIFHVFLIYLFAGKVDSNAFVENLTCIMGLEETAWGKMCVMTVGSFQFFMEIVTSTVLYKSESSYSPESQFSGSLFEQLILP